MVPLVEATDGRPLVVFALSGFCIKKGSTAPVFTREARWCGGMDPPAWGSAMAPRRAALCVVWPPEGGG
ncbi:hypothetical protein U9M48_007414 [Paspalum notatum var. saurae]|uniref:Uncharacterized protein n=1 Tax=Paspalum notatum var. saurae TaxID=547442 RepID=A0AAQ3SKB1_PASNO